MVVVIVIVVVVILLLGVAVADGVIIGSGTANPVSRWYGSGQREVLGAHSRLGRQGSWLYWNIDGSLDENKTGYYRYGVRLRSLDEGERRTDLTASWQMSLDVLAIGAASQAYDRATQRWTSDFVELQSCEAAAEVLENAATRPLDPWRRPYLVSVAANDKGVVVLTLGADGVSGGVGEREDVVVKIDADGIVKQ